MYEPRTFTSKVHPVKLVAKEMDEPNPGRMIWRYEFWVNGKIVQDKSIDYRWSGLFPNLDNVQFESEDSRYYFIPAEGVVLYDWEQKSFYKTPASREFKNNAFVGNAFTEDYLVMVMQRSFLVLHVDRKKSVEVIFPFGELQIKSFHMRGSLLTLQYKDLSDFATKEKAYDIGKTFSSWE